MTETIKKPRAKKLTKAQLEIYNFSAKRELLMEAVQTTVDEIQAAKRMKAEADEAERVQDAQHREWEAINLAEREEGEVVEIPAFFRFTKMENDAIVAKKNNTSTIINLSIGLLLGAGAFYLGEALHFITIWQ